jgi:hypothetical protein
MYPTHAYYQAAEITKSLLKFHGGNIDIQEPEIFQQYYKNLYDLNDIATQQSELTEAITGLDFPAVAKHYRLIAQDTIQVVVPWSEQMTEYEELRLIAMKGIHQKWITRAQRLCVNIYRPKPDHPAWDRLVEARLSRGGSSTEWFVLEDPDRNDPTRRMYDDILGLRLPDQQQVLIA